MASQEVSINRVEFEMGSLRASVEGQAQFSRRLDDASSSSSSSGCSSAAGKMSQSPGRAILIGMAFLIGLIADCEAVRAQGQHVPRTSQSRERTREMIDDYSNSLGAESDFDRPRQPSDRFPAGGKQPDVNAIRPLIRAFVESTSQLTYALNDQMSQLPGLKRVYTDALRLSGAAAKINKRAEEYGVDGAMLDDLEQLDADWRELAYRMENIRGLSSDAKDLIVSINEADQRMRQVIGIQPQFDRRQLGLKASSLVAALENLQEDIASELGNSRDSQFYRRSISRVRQVVLNLLTILRDDRTEAGVIVSEYRQFETLWTPLLAKLRSEDDRYIERGLRRVAASAGEIHQRLLLPQKMDPTQFVYLAKSLKRDIDDFFERTPLILVMQLPNAKQALPVADQFYAVCARFVEVANRSQDQAEIVDSFRKLEQAARAFNDVYADIDSDRAVAVLNRVGQTVNSLRSSLQIQHDDFDSRSAADLAASIQNFTEQIEVMTKRWLESDRQPFTSDCLQDAADLSDRAARLHDDIIAGKSPSELKSEMTELYEIWRRVYGYLVKCQTEERPFLGRLSASLTPAVVDLKALIGQ